MSIRGIDVAVKDGTCRHKPANEPPSCLETNLTCASWRIPRSSGAWWLLPADTYTLQATTVDGRVEEASDDDAAVVAALETADLIIVVF